MTITVTIKPETGYAFNCPVCQWRGIDRTPEHAKWLVEYHVRDVHKMEVSELVVTLQK